MRHLIVFAILAGLGGFSQPLVEPICGDSMVLTGGCPQVGGGISGDSAVISGEVGVPGGSGSGNSSAGGGGAGAAADDDEPCLQPVNDRCLVRSPRERPGDPLPPVTPPVTLRDLASFRPDPGVQYMEPDGWTIAGLDTNFYAVAPVQVQSGTLLGRPAAVRFTPVAFHWDYGDGSTASRATGGGTWTSLGVAEFAPTPTSHVYRSAGDYLIRLTIEFRAEYRFGAGAFLPIDGRLSRPANDLRIRSGTAKTVLVERECSVAPAGPGC